MCIRRPPSTVAGLGVAGGFARRWHCLAANHGGDPDLASGMEAERCLRLRSRLGTGAGTPEGREGQGQCVFAGHHLYLPNLVGFPCRPQSPGAWWLLGVAAARRALGSTAGVQGWGTHQGCQVGRSGSRAPWCHHRVSH